MAIFLTGIQPVFALSVTTIDTVFTPPGYSDGDLSATLYLPDQPNGAAVIAVHELGMARSSVQIWCDTLAAHGYLVMTIDYPDPVNQQAHYPSPPRALKIATQFLRRSATTFHIDPERIGAIGRSLGAGIVGECIIADRDTALFHTDPAVDDHLDAAVMLYGIYDFQHYTQTNLGLSIAQFTGLYFRGNTAMETKGTAVLNASKVTTPVLLIHGTAGPTLQVEQSSEFHDSLDAHGKSNELLLFSGQPHLFETNSSNTAFTAIGLTVKDSVLHFFNRILAVKSDVPQSADALAPTRPALNEIFPNPSTNAMTVVYTMPCTQWASLKFFDAMGAEVGTLVSGSQDAGTHAAVFHTALLPSGLYLCCLKTGGTIQTSCVRIVH